MYYGNDTPDDWRDPLSSQYGQFPGHWMTPSESTPESGRKTERKLAMATPGSPDNSGGETVIRRRGKSSYRSYADVKALPSLLPSASATSSSAVSSSSTTGPPQKGGSSKVDSTTGPLQKGHTVVVVE